MAKRKLPDPIRPSNRYGEGLDTKAQANALKAANKLLGKAKFFAKRDRSALPPIDADACGAHGLKPTWHGKA